MASFKEKIEKNKITLVIVLSLISIVSNIILADLYVLPKKTISDQIIQFTRVKKKYRTRFGYNETTLGYFYLTKNNNKFMLANRYAINNQITISKTCIFKSVSHVKTNQKDYSFDIVSGFNFFNIFCVITLSIFTTTSLVFLRLKSNITENAYLNIIAFNIFMIFIIAYMYFMYN